jgi:hypothetical protein
MFKKALFITIAITLLFVGINYTYDLANLQTNWVFMGPVVLVCIFFGFAKLCAWILKIPNSKSRLTIKMDDTLPPPAPKPQNTEKQ